MALDIFANRVAGRGLSLSVDRKRLDGSEQDLSTTTPKQCQ
jgi:hypothetical protein